ALAEATGRAYPLQACADVHPRSSAPLPGGAGVLPDTLHGTPRRSIFWHRLGPSVEFIERPRLPGCLPRLSERSLRMSRDDAIPAPGQAGPGSTAPASMDAFWMPFTANRQFRRSPRLLAAAEGMYYRDVEGRQILDGTAGLWCCNAGHARPRIVEAIARQAATMDFAPHFQMGSPLPFDLAGRLKELAPRPLDHVF